MLSFTVSLDWVGYLGEEQGDIFANDKDCSERNTVSTGGTTKLGG